MAPYGSLQWLRITQPLLTNGMTGNEYLYFYRINEAVRI